MTTFIYYSPKISKITNLFKHTNVGIYFKKANTLQQLTRPKIDNNMQEQDKSGIYELTCNTCHMSYQTDEPQLKTKIPRTHQLHKTQ